LSQAGLHQKKNVVVQTEIMKDIIYCDIDKNVCEWNENLIKAGEIPNGEVWCRSIKDIKPGELAGVRQFHAFAGIGGWPLALRLAGWPEDREVWTGSCPCQPFSSAGKGLGVNDPRHLWPDFFRLIKERRPVTIFGEQVGSKAGIGWLDGVQADLEGENYTCGAVIVGAHSVGAPHIRQRLYWVADGKSSKAGSGHDIRGGQSDTGESCSTGGLGHSDGDENNTERPADQQGRDAVGRDEQAVSERKPGDDGVGRSGEVGRLADNDSERLQDRRQGRPEPNGVAVSSWSDYRIIPCTDGRFRRTGRGVRPLAARFSRDMGSSKPELRGISRVASRNRNGRLKGYGNSIVPALAAQFVMAYLEST
jgi:DNA (cytosine-5)-methyltransferase 1